MAKITSSLNFSHLEPNPSGESSVEDSSVSGQIVYDETGFYLREVRLLHNENSTLIKTENGDNILLSILYKDTVDVQSKIENKKNIDNG